MDPGESKQDAGVVNMTRAKEALSPWLNHPRKTIVQVEGLVLAAAVLLLLQLILGSCRRRWHNSFIKYGLQVCNGIMFPLTVYTLGTMQSSPIKNALYPVWAAFLIMASAGTTAVWRYDFYDSFNNKYMMVLGEYLRDAFYALMFLLLLEPNNLNLKTHWGLATKGHEKKYRTSSICVLALVAFVVFTKLFESVCLVIFGYNKLQARNLIAAIMKIIPRKQAPAESREEISGNDGASSDSDPHNIKGYKYAVCYRLRGGGLITIDQVWDSCGNSSAAHDGNALKDICLSYALSQWLRQRYFGLVVYPETSRLKGHDFVFKKLLPSSDSQVDYSKRAFRIIESELGFCYDFFFTKYFYTFFWTNLLRVPFIQSLILIKIILILMVGVLAIRRSLVLETPNPLIEVHISEADYISTIAVLGIALVVEVVQTLFYLASNWAQVSLACMHVKKRCHESNACIFGKFIGLLRSVMISQQLKSKIDQRSLILRLEQQPKPVEVSDAVKNAIARSLRSTYANNLSTSEEASLRLHKQMFDQYSWALKDLSGLEVMLIWHIATEYCHISDDPSNRNGITHQGTYFEYLLQLLRPEPRSYNRIAPDGPRGVAVHLSRYCAYLITSVPEVLPYQEATITELRGELVNQRIEFFGLSFIRSETYSKLKNLEGTGEEDDPKKTFQKGVKLGKQLERMPDGDRWKVLEDFWAEMIIHFAASPYTAKQHMLHLENGGQFLTHIWALLAHAGILDRDKDQQGQGVRIPDPHVQVTQEADLRSAPSGRDFIIRVNDDRGAFSSPL